ncbi:hypothetical protein [Streptomyces sp. R35]|uniref:Uncharacterized protein n=1 Tax=Streptomyces sp. R35 TaxID=3238630 RepID=A0AB39SE90_9ACTN
MSIYGSRQRLWQVVAHFDDWMRLHESCRYRNGCQRGQAAWQRAAGLVEYVGALRLHAEGLPPGPAREEAEAWIAWAESHVQRLNPLNGSPSLAEIPEPRTEDLKPFMHGWSPYGPTY